MSKTYVYWRSTGPNKKDHRRIEKKEDELNEQELDFFFGDLINNWNKTPPKMQEKFMKIKIREVIDVMQINLDNMSLDCHIDLEELI